MTEDSIRIHQLPEFEECGYLPSIEYFLPVRGMPEKERRILGPWLENIASMAEAEARTTLSDRWQKNTNPALDPIVDYYLQFHPTSIVVQDERAWLMCLRPETPETEVSIFLLPPPVERDVIVSRCQEHGFDNSLLVELLLMFSGMRESFAPAGGRFIEAGELWRLMNESWMVEQEGFPEWEGSMFLFESDVSNTLLLHPRGKVGWWVGEESRIYEYAPSLQEFCRLFAEYRIAGWVRVDWIPKKIAWPFDFFGFEHRL